NTKGLIASSNGRPEESLALIRRSLEIALENDTPSAALRAYANLANEMFERDRYDESTRLDLEVITLAHRLGWSGPEWFAKMKSVGRRARHVARGPRDGRSGRASGSRGDRMERDGGRQEPRRGRGGEPLLRD